MAITSGIIKQFGTRQYINSLQIDEDDSNDAESEQVSIHYSFPQFKMLAHCKLSIVGLGSTVYKNGKILIYIFFIFFYYT